MENNLSYSVIPKGRGFLYARDSQLYMRVKTQGNIKYLKCIQTGCDGSMKLVDDEIIRGVRKHPLNLCTLIFTHSPIRRMRYCDSHSVYVCVCVTK